MPNDRAGFTTESVARLVYGHDARMERHRIDWNRYRASFETRFWLSENRWRSGLRSEHGFDDDGIPVKVEVNMVAPLVNGIMGSLFRRRVRTFAIPPAWLPSGPGRPRGPTTIEDQQAMAAFGDELVNSQHVQQLSMHAYMQGVMYGSVAFKLTVCEHTEGEVPERLRFSVIEPWNLMLDERRTWDESRYVGHLRFASADWVATKFEGVVLPEWAKPTHVPDFLDDGLDRLGDPPDEPRDEAYLRILELYDRTGNFKGKRGVLRYYIIGSDGLNAVAEPKLFLLGEDPMPYSDGAGNPVVPIVPVVLQNVPEYPLRSVSVVRPTYEINAERNLLLSILASAMRRDANRIILYLKGKGLNDEEIEQIVNGDDLTLVGVDAETLEGLLTALELPRLAGSLDKYKGWLMEAAQDVRQVSSLTQGAPGSVGLTPVSAAEARIRADASEAASGRVGKRMNEAIGKALQLAAIVVAQELKDQGRKSLKLRRPGHDPYTIPVDLLAERWQFQIVDSSATPVQEAQQKMEFLQLLPTLQSIGVQLEPEQGQPETALHRLMRQTLDYIVETWDLPEGFSWTTIGAAEEVQEIPVDKAVDVALAMNEAGVTGAMDESPGAPATPLPPGVV